MTPGEIGCLWLWKHFGDYKELLTYFESESENVSWICSKSSTTAIQNGISIWRFYNLRQNFGILSIFHMEWKWGKISSFFLAEKSTSESWTLKSISNMECGPKSRENIW